MEKGPRKTRKRGKVLDFARLCLNCLLRRGRQEPLAPHPFRHRLAVAGQTFSAILQGGRCPVCGVINTVDAMADHTDRVAEHLAAEGVRHGEVVRLLRESVYMGATELADLLGVKRQTIYRWETGRTPIDKATFVVLRQLHAERSVDNHELTEYLELLDGPRPPGGPPRRRARLRRRRKPKGS